MLKVVEIFRGCQGESSYAGKPCVFIRLTGCNLRCSYCDTKYAYKKGERLFIREVIDRVKKLLKPGDIIEITGGEPLNQIKELNKLLISLKRVSLDSTPVVPVLIETNGSCDVSKLTREKLYYPLVVVMDYKLPSSGMEGNMMVSNFKYLSSCDEIKFVVGSMEDYERMKTIMKTYPMRAQVLVSTVWGVNKREIVEKMLEDGVRARFQIQLHKLIWEPNARGV